MKARTRHSVLLPVLSLLITASYSAYADEPAEIYTPNNSLVTDTYFIDERLSEADKQAWQEYVEATYPGAVILDEATSTYNCHGYAWHISEGGERVWLGVTDVDAEDIYWEDKSYVAVDDDYTKISYASDNHSAVAAAEEGWFVSKWGEGCLVKHQPANCPYTASNLNYYILANNIVFCIDDTGSMGEEISYAQAAAVAVLADNQAANRSCYYTLFSFKDGPATLRGQTSDEAQMEGWINSLYADGGGGCPESSLTAIRQGAELSPYSDIMMMTDASSNSYGVDDTYATYGEVFETIFTLVTNHSHLNAIVYSTCGELLNGHSDNGHECLTCRRTDSNGDLNKEVDGARPMPDDPAGEEGYNLVCTESGGLYFRIDSSETEEAVEIILRESSADGKICFYDGEVISGEVTHEIPVDESVSQLHLVLNRNVGALVSLEVENSRGEIIDDTTPGVSILQVGGNTYYQIEEEAIHGSGVGVWTARVSGSGTYRFSGSCETDNPMVYLGETTVGIGGTLHLLADLSREVENISFELVSLDGTEWSPVIMYDDGAHGDGEAGDLLFAGTLVMEEVGSFRFRAKGDDNFARMYSAKINVGVLEVVASPTQYVSPGDIITHMFEVSNLGSAEDTYDVYSSATEGWADLSGVPAELTIDAGYVVNVEIPVYVPVDAAPGAFERLSIQAVSQENSTINDTDATKTRVIDPTPIIEVLPAYFNYDTLQVGEVSEPAVFTMRNVGTVDLNVMNVALSDELNYSLDPSECGDLPLVLGPGEECELLVSFHPSTSGVLDAVLEVVSDDPDKPVLVVPLFGTGESTEAIICDHLGRDQWWHSDWDVYLFNGCAGEEITVSLFEDSEITLLTSDRATLVVTNLVSGHGRCPLFREDSSSLPNSISLTLPCDDLYSVVVIQQPWWVAYGSRFTGDYCVTLESTGEAAGTFRRFRH